MEFYVTKLKCQGTHCENPPTHIIDDDTSTDTYYCCDKHLKYRVKEIKKAGYKIAR